MNAGASPRLMRGLWCCPPPCWGLSLTGSQWSTSSLTTLYTGRPRGLQPLPPHTTLLTPDQGQGQPVGLPQTTDNLLASCTPLPPSYYSRMQSLQKGGMGGNLWDLSERGTSFYLLMLMDFFPISASRNASIHQYRIISETCLWYGGALREVRLGARSGDNKLNGWQEAWRDQYLLSTEHVSWSSPSSPPSGCICYCCRTNNYLGQDFVNTNQSPGTPPWLEWCLLERIQLIIAFLSLFSASERSVALEMRNREN